jgi:4-hydroxyphenylpyruvate dioxygenase-like putative hemolysin
MKANFKHISQGQALKNAVSNNDAHLGKIRGYEHGTKIEVKSVKSWVQNQIMIIINFLTLSQISQISQIMGDATPD